MTGMISLLPCLFSYNAGSDVGTDVLDDDTDEDNDHKNDSHTAAGAAPGAGAAWCLLSQCYLPVRGTLFWHE